MVQGLGAFNAPNRRSSGHLTAVAPEFEGRPDEVPLSRRSPSTAVEVENQATMGRSGLIRTPGTIQNDLDDPKSLLLWTHF